MGPMNAAGSGRQTSEQSEIRLSARSVRTCACQRARPRAEGTVGEQGSIARPVKAKHREGAAETQRDPSPSLGRSAGRGKRTATVSFFARAYRSIGE